MQSPRYESSGNTKQRQSLSYEAQGKGSAAPRLVQTFFFADLCAGPRPRCSISVCNCEPPGRLAVSQSRNCCYAGQLM